MSVTKNQLVGLTKDAQKAAQVIREHINKGNVIHVSTHVDADGISAGGIMGTALLRAGAKFRLRLERWMDEKVADRIAEENAALTIFTDMGSGYLDILGERLKSDVVILDHHQPVTDQVPSNFVQVNPHIHGIDGTREISGSGVSYFAAKALNENNIDLACLAIVGALGDLQDKNKERKLGGANKPIVEDAVKSGGLKVETDLLFFGRETRPIHQALARTTNPFIPEISGEEDKSLAFLVNLGIKPKDGDKWRALRDLSGDEKKKLLSAIADHLVSKGMAGDVAFDLVGEVYTLTKEEPWTPLRSAREFSVLLNATGRMDKAGLGAAICMGDRKKCLEQATNVISDYRRTITKYLRWITEKPGRLEELENIYVVRGDGFIDEKVLSPVCTILSTTLTQLGKPIIAYATISGEDQVKISSRGSEPLIQKGLNLGDIMLFASEKHSGRGGGHDVAAGAQIPIKEVDSFIKLVDGLVKRQLEGEKIGS
ncbi:MAG: DHH family phosphoesterase [Candidatus Bathyarchaeota archaeon]|nr:DHH family phosphoesterase [Candidatus Bathyarchaeota archaeon]